MKHAGRSRPGNSFLIMTLSFILMVSCVSFFSVQNISSANERARQFIHPPPRAATVPGNSNPTGDEWPMFHRSLNHTGVTVSVPAQRSTPFWSYATGNTVFSSPVVVNDRLYAGSWDKNVYCLNATTGDKIWNFTTGNYVISSQAVANERVFVSAYDKNVYCLNATTGAKLWNFTTGLSMQWSSPAISGNRVYVGSQDHKLWCLDAFTGAFIWSFTTGNLVDSSPAVANGHVYFGSADYKVYCVNALTGVQLWNYTTGRTIISAPAVVGDRVVVGSRDFKVYCLNATTGKPLWNYTTGGNVYSSPAIDNGHVFIGSDDTQIYCLDAISGLKVWNFTTAGLVFSSPAIADDRVFVGCNNNKMYCLNETTGACMWYYSTGGSVESPAVASGRVFVGCTDFKVYCFPMILTGFTPDNPYNFQATGGNGKITLTWWAPVIDNGIPITNYNIYRGTSSGGEVYLATTGNVLTYIDTAVVSGLAYYYTINAVNGAGEGLKSMESSATPTGNTAPSALQNMQAFGGNGQVVLSWQAPASNGGSAITNYKIYQGMTAGGEALLATLGIELGYTSTGLTNGQLYYFKVAAVNGIGTSANSTETSAMPLATIPTAPQALSATAGTGQVVLTWTPPTSNGGHAITGYKVYQGTAPGGEMLLATIGNVTTYIATGLTGEQAYYYKVSAMNSAGEGTPSSEATATPASTPSPTTTISGYPIEFSIFLLAITWVIILARTRRKSKN